ncbi:MAG: flavodoxin-dependent (E)-4-hydroxy-3-methylbut-2-enyl-diphosphate synthase [Selenomonadaceae bacterium]|nr:flavodoxin-dependent (E)-4-hydroxy-3-methylbut-2-enyl-diphosphate synthase [Selenomonadaceae bacterium]
MIDRKLTRQISVGGVKVGGGAPISIQSMTNTKTHDAAATIEQVQRLAAEGCDIVRVAVPDMTAAKSLGAIVPAVDVPIVADIHFDYKLALEAIAQGVAALRLNPGNIGGAAHVREVVKAARASRIPIRIGVNAGSLSRKLLAKYGGATAEALVESAMEHVAILEAEDFFDIKISLKAHDVPLTLAAYRLASKLTNYPLHLGITEAGTINSGVIKSAVGIGALLAEGIGDTIRVSLTGDPIAEVKVAKEILKSLGLREGGVTLIACPTCGRTRIDLPAIAAQVEERLNTIKQPLTVAVMGCIVNGPGEARTADVGIAGADGEGIIFRKGQIVRKVPEAQLVAELFKEIDAILAAR